MATMPKTILQQQIRSRSKRHTSRVRRTAPFDC